MQFFEENAENPKKVKVLIEKGAGDEWASTYSASRYSPALIVPSEDLARQVLEPVHWDSSASELKPGFFDDIGNKGLSVSRLAYTDIDTVAEAGRVRAQATGKTFIGTLLFAVNEALAIMRSVPEEGSGAVFDTALLEDIAHAEVCQTLGDRGHMRSMRSDLFDHLKGRVQRA